MVEYDRDDPTRNRLVHTTLANHGPAATVFMAVLFLAGLALVLFELRALRHRRQLLALGLAASAVVKSVERWTSMDRRSHGFRVVYRFTVNGAEYTGSVVVGKRAPAINSPLWVLYDEARPEQNLAA